MCQEGRKQLGLAIPGRSSDEDGGLPAFDCRPQLMADDGERRVVGTRIASMQTIVDKPFVRVWPYQ